MDALKKSVQAKGRTKVRAVVGKHIGPSSAQAGHASVATTKAKLTAHRALISRLHSPHYGASGPAKICATGP